METPKCLEKGMVQKTWKVKKKLSKKPATRLEAIIDVLLKNRGLIKQKQQESFFKPIHPHKISFSSIGIKTGQIQKALKRLKRAFDKEELIVIYGDYDADGITATAVLWEALYSLGFKVMPFLPHRENHGYGLKKEGIDAAIKKYGKPELIITVDNGIVAFEGLDYCKELGIDVIITDHHAAKKEKNGKETYPEACAIIHSIKTAGAGVAYLFTKEVLKHFKPDHSIQTLDSFLELTTIGTVADIIPLLDINRSIVKTGLELLTRTQRPGLRALLTEAGINANTALSTYHIGFVVAPRLNAMGRLDNCFDSLRLLCTQDEQRAFRLALDLGDVNKQRQDLTFNSVTKALKTHKNKHEDKKVIITASKDYSPGVIGLVAGKLVEQFYKPTIVIAETGDVAKGSARSVWGVNIIEMLRTFEEDFLELGGHPMAAGFTIATKKINELTEKMERLAEEAIEDHLLKPVLEAETEIELSDITLDLYKAVETFAPFGAGNPHPVFITRNVKVKNVQTVGKDKRHLKLQVTKDSSPIYEAMFFSAGLWTESLKPGNTVDLAYQITLNEWNGNTKLQLVVKDIRVS